GVARRIEVDVSIPVVVVDARGGQVLSLDPSATLGNLGIGFGDNPRDLEKKIRSGDVKIRTYSFSQLRDVGHVPVDFNEGTSVGLGRISMGTKASVFETGRFGLGAACDFYFPSPSEREYAGSDSASIFPVLIGTFRLADRARLSADAGYDYDFDVQQLRRFVWRAGVWFPLERATFDLGVSGSQYAAPIEWTPNRVNTTPALTVLGSNEVGTTAVDFLAGVKVRLGSSPFALSGAVTVPVAGASVQPIVAGTVAFEAAF